MAHEMAETAANLIQKRYNKDIPMQIDVVKEPDNLAIGNGSGIMYHDSVLFHVHLFLHRTIYCFSIAAETTTGCILAASALGKRNVSAHDVGIQAAEDLLEDLSYRSCVDRHLQDQVRICRYVNLSECLLMFPINS